MACAQPKLDLTKCPYCGTSVEHEIWKGGKVLEVLFRCNTVSVMDDIVQQSDRCKKQCGLKGGMLKPGSKMANSESGPEAIIPLKLTD